MPTRDEPWPDGTPCWVDCQVDDTTAARDFYGALFGWDIQDSPPDAGGYLMALKNGQVAAGIGPKPEGAPMPSVWSTYFAAADADAVAESVGAAGGQLMMPAFDVMDVGRMFFATDPAGAAFGVWQAASHRGAGIYNEEGAYCWNELHTRDYQGARDFYTTVFGWSYDDIGDGETMRYAVFKRPDGEGVGGMNDDTLMPGEMPSYWLTWFQVDDTEASAARVGELGGSVMMAPEVTPFGHMAIVTGAQGEVFGLINPTVTSAPG